MHGLLLAAAFAAQSGAPDADPRWSRVNGGPEHSTYLDRRSIRASGAMRTAWTRTDYQTPTASGAYRTYFRQDADCARRTLTMIEFVNHDRAGRVVSQGTIPMARRRTGTVMPDSQGEALLDMLCR